MSQEHTVRIDTLNCLGKSCKVAMVHPDSLLLKNPLFPILEMLRMGMIQGVCFSAVSKKNFNENHVKEIFARSEIIEIPYNDRFGATQEDLLLFKYIRYLKLYDSSFNLKIEGDHFVELSVELGKHISLGQLDNLKRLSVDKLLNWDQIPSLPSVEVFGVNQSSIIDLNGLGKFKCLNSLGLGYLSKLKSLDYCNVLSSLDSFSVTNLSQYASPLGLLDKLHTLKSLSIKDCKFLLPNLDFILPMPLGKLDVVRTEVTQISPLVLTKINAIPWAYIKTKKI